jgi:excisionase family DNA binding protein
VTESIVWLSTKDCCARLGVTVRTLYRFIDEGQLVAYQMGRVIRVQEPDLDKFVESVKIAPGSLAHLYPDTGAPDGLAPRDQVNELDLDDELPDG